MSEHESVEQVIERKKSKKITNEQLQQIADKYGIPLASLKSVIEVECRGHGFTASGEPTILFEPHIFYSRLTKKNFITLRNRIMVKEPDLCYAKWKQGLYGSYASQHKKLQRAVKYERDCALESCSWGLGQVMGYHWKSLGFSSLQEFINLVYRDEMGQVEVMMRYLEKNDLLESLREQNWHSFALGYNGKGYKKNQYHVKLKQAYEQFA